MRWVREKYVYYRGIRFYWCKATKKKKIIIFSILVGLFSCHKYATRESYNGRKWCIPSASYVCIWMYLILMWKKNTERHIYHLRAHAIIIKWEKRVVWIERDNEYTRCYTFRYTIIEFRLNELTTHSKRIAFSTFACTSYINRSVKEMLHFIV